MLLSKRKVLTTGCCWNAIFPQATADYQDIIADFNFFFLFVYLLSGKMMGKKIQEHQVVYYV